MRTKIYLICLLLALLLLGCAQQESGAPERGTGSVEGPAQDELQIKEGKMSIDTEDAEQLVSEIRNVNLSYNGYIELY
ncbi:MAG: hypothetical protein ACLFVI_08695 [Archaeoglobaceae archaeon]